MLMQVEEDPVRRDASARAQAVTSLASVAQELHSPSQPAAAAAAHGAHARDSDAQSGEGRAGRLQAEVFAPLLAAMQDYSTDNRCAASC